MVKNTPLSLDDLFGGCDFKQKENSLTKVNHDIIDTYPNQPRYLTQENIEKGFLESVKAYGVYEPVILSVQKNGRRLMLAGHKRLLANKLAGYEEILAIEKHGLEQWQEKIIVAHTNFQQGIQNMSQTERYRSMSLEMEALVQFRQYLRDNKLDLSGEIELDGRVFKFEHLEKSREIIAKRYSVKPSDVQRMMRLKYLSADFMHLLDEKKMPLNAGVALSYLTTEQQNQVYSTLDNIKITLEKAVALRELSEQEMLSEDKIAEILNGICTKTAKEKRVALSPKLINTYFTGKAQNILQAF